MIIRNFQEKDFEQAKEIFALYWTDPEFLKELSSELQVFIDMKGNGTSGFFVAEEDNKIIGIIGYKKLVDYLKPYTLTDNPVEFYVIAVKNKRMGVGKKLKQKLLEEAQKLGFSEIILYSPGTHDESWHFHDSQGFERLGEVTPPDDDIGQVWRKVL